MKLNKYTTHIWLYGAYNPNFYGGFRRWQYRKIRGEWFSLDVTGKWVKSNNPKEWFQLETDEGWFLTREQYLDSFRFKKGI